MSVALARELTSFFFASLPLSLGSSSGHSSTAPPSERLQSLIIRADNYTPEKLINIFDTEGSKVFTIERSRRGSNQWYVYAEPSHVQVSAIKIGLFDRKVQINDQTINLQVESGIFGKLHRTFYDKAGDLFSWNRRSRSLERISNPGGLLEEERHKIAYIQQLRKRRFEFELLVDASEIDPLHALGTAFVTLKTQWSTLYPRNVPGQLKLGRPGYTVAKGQFENDLAEQMRIYEPRPESKAPRDFFNPPGFMIRDELRRNA